MNEDESEEGKKTGKRKDEEVGGRERERETGGPIYCVFSSPSQTEMLRL